MSDFEILPDSERPTSGSHGRGVVNPVHEAIAEGKTVFISLNGRAAHDIRNAASSYLRRRGLNFRARITERDGVKGLIAWAEPKDADR